MRVRPGMSLATIAREMGKVGVLGPKRFARAVEILTEMFADDSYTNFLSLAGPMVPGGLRELIGNLIKLGCVHALVTTGANVTHDLIEAIGYRHYVGEADADDVRLRGRRLSRIYDLYVSERSMEALEKVIHRFLDAVPEAKRMNMATFELLWTIGEKLKDQRSIVKVATKKQVPIFCPGIFDSMVGLNLWSFSQLRSLHLNPLRDFTRLVEMTYEADRIGVIILGGGMPKHHTLVASVFRGGIDSAVQITMDRPEPGGTSGAPLEEAISWRKIRGGRNVSNVIGDATVLFPLICTAALENRKRSKRKVSIA